MPRKARSATPLSLSEFDKLTVGLTELFSRLRVTLASNAEAQAIVDRLTSAGFLPPSRPGRAAAAAKAPAAVAATGGRRKRGRRRRPIDSDKVIAAVKKGGAAGQTSGQIATTLGIPVDRLRFQLYTLRDSGALKMLGDKSTAKYVVAPAKASAAPANKTVAKAAHKAGNKGAKKKVANGVAKKKGPAKAAAPSAPPAA